VLGKQGEEYLSEFAVNFNHLPSLSDKLDLGPIAVLRDEILSLYTKGCSARFVLYTRVLLI